MSEAHLLTSPRLSRAGFSHAFFSRRGGVSEGPFESLSFSLAVGDRKEHVAENLRRAGAALGVASDRIFYLSQVHGTDARIADGSESQQALTSREGDAVVSSVTSLACGVRSADCVPVLLADADSGAVAAIHAGWRGAASNVVASAVGALRSLIGREGELIAAIGPHIEQGAFEVSEDVATQLRRASPDPDVVDEGGLKPHVDLRRIVRAQLVELGVASDCIDDVRGCTYSDPTLFFSHRRDGKKSGRHLSAIVPRGR